MRWCWWRDRIDFIDTDPRVVVQRIQGTAELQRHGRDDLAMEAAVSRLSLEPSASSVTWTTAEPDPLTTLDE